MRLFRYNGLAVFALAPMLVACGGAKPDPAPSLDALDRELTGTNAAAPGAKADPALTAALHDQIMVDPDLVQQANRNALRPPPRPADGATPPVDVAAQAGPAEHDVLRHAPPAHGTCRECAAARQALTLGALPGRPTGQVGTCTNSISYTATWSTRLPASVPLYPDARVTEAAGADGVGCALRIVSFTSSASPQRMLDWYYTKTSAAGFSAGRGADADGDMLAGRHAGSGAYLVSVRPHAGGGSDVDLMADAR
ncbi:MAG: hypothetical protein ACRYFW_11455 [Janthinobacterium lividum]